MSSLVTASATLGCFCLFYDVYTSVGYCAGQKKKSELMLKMYTGFSRSFIIISFDLAKPPDMSDTKTPVDVQTCEMEKSCPTTNDKAFEITREIKTLMLVDLTSSIRCSIFTSPCSCIDL